MQIILIASPLGEIKRVNLSARLFIFIAVFCVVTLVFAALGIKNSNLSSISIQSFRTPVGTDENTTGSQVSGSTVQNLINLEHINLELEKYGRKIAQLESANARLILLATPPELQDRFRKYKGIGGPYLPLTSINQNYDGSWDALDPLHQELKQKNNDLAQSVYRLIQDIDYLERVPIGFPLSKRRASSSNYGVRVDPIKKQHGVHQGIDFPAPKGALIVSSGAGIVEHAGWDKDYGNTVSINHGNGYISRYAHASEIMVTSGQKVNRQVAIAKVGNTGRSTGSHLHFEILKKGVPINPTQLLTVTRNDSPPAK